MSLAGGTRRSSVSVFDKRIPRNPKYSSVQPVIDTGPTVKKALVVLSDQQVSKRRGELFRRVKNSRIADLLKSVESSEIAESVDGLIEGLHEADPHTVEPAQCARSVVAPTVMSVGAQSAGVVSVIESAALGIVDSRDMLIVDLRTLEEYRQSRIMFAIHHPATLLVRDVLHPSMLAFKRKLKGRYLLVYHNDERHTAQFATLLVEKGWEEVFVVDGGLDGFRESYPELIDTDDQENNGQSRRNSLTSSGLKRLN